MQLINEEKVTHQLRNERRPFLEFVNVNAAAHGMDEPHTRVNRGGDSLRELDLASSSHV